MVSEGYHFPKNNIILCNFNYFYSFLICSLYGPYHDQCAYRHKMKGTKNCRVLFHCKLINSSFFLQTTKLVWGFLVFFNVKYSILSIASMVGSYSEKFSESWFPGGC